MKVIHKHEIGPGVYTLELPADAVLLHVQEQYGRPVLWVLGDPDTRKVKRWFKVVGTGQAEPHDRWEGWEYVGTCKLVGGDYVLHLFAEQT